MRTQRNRPHRFDRLRRLESALEYGLPYGQSPGVQIKRRPPQRQQLPDELVGAVERLEELIEKSLEYAQKGIPDELR